MYSRWILLFVLGVIAVLMAAPLVLTVFTSLKPTTELVNPAWYPPIDLTFEHYLRVWTEGGFNRYFFNTLVISVIDAIVMVVIASLAAYAMLFNVSSSLRGIYSKQTMSDPKDVGELAQAGKERRVDGAS